MLYVRNQVLDPHMTRFRVHVIVNGIMFNIIPIILTARNKKMSSYAIKSVKKIFPLGSLYKKIDQYCRSGQTPYYVYT